MRLSGNQECADCGTRGPEWASANHGTMICIDCAGTHRSLGSHVSKVKSLTLDAWKPEEIRLFVSKGGNKVVNAQLASRLPRLPAGASRTDVDRHISAKYQGLPHLAQSTSQKTLEPTEDTSHLSQSESQVGVTCHQGLVIAEVVSVDLDDDRVRELRMLGPVFLNLTVVVSLGSVESDRTAPRRGSQVATWEPPERRELLWDAEERWLRISIYDGGLAGRFLLAAKGKIDLLELVDQGCGTMQSLEVELFAPADEDDGNEDCGSDSEDGRAERCGEACVQLTIIDMTGMLSSQEKKADRKRDAGTS